jgi:sigma-B regulation protein RsbU (phosphoserine phosphatase)
VLGLETGILDYSNAGHPPAMLVRGPEAERLRVLSRTGPPLGIDRDSSWEYAAVSLQPGDQLVLYTDGISEARNPDSQLFGIERLVQTVLANSSRSAAETQETILRLVDRFGGDQPRADDIALVVARRMPAGRAEASGPTAVSQPLARD